VTVSPHDESAAGFFAAKLRFETDPSDVAAARASGGPAPLLIDVRDDAGWEQGHVPGARHLPLRDLGDRLASLPLPEERPHLVVYCWGPGCNAATKAALLLVRAGHRHVQEMIGGFEYWAREGLAIEGADGRSRRAVDPLTAPAPGPRGGAGM
jgi:rhodanese-related sulfurtransferase